MLENAHGSSDPLLGIWSPEALDRLTQNVSRGVTALTRVLTDLDGHTYGPRVTFRFSTPILPRTGEALQASLGTTDGGSSPRRGQ